MFHSLVQFYSTVFVCTYLCLCLCVAVAADTRQKTVVTHGERAEVRRRQDNLRMEGEFVGREQRTTQTKSARAAGVPSGAGTVRYGTRGIGRRGRQQGHS